MALFANRRPPYSDGSRPGVDAPRVQA